MRAVEQGRVDDPVTRYALDVLCGKEVAGPWVRLAGERHLRDLERTDVTWDLESAKRNIRFFPSVLRLNGGEFEGVPFNLSTWQQFIVGSLFGWKRPDGMRRFRTAYIEAGKGSGKALAIDTPIPTPTGWTTMGELRVGDQVLSESGQPCTVTAVTDVMHDRPCYELVFDDGERIVADAQHLWFTEQRKHGTDRGASKRGVPKRLWGQWRSGLRTTEIIADTLLYANGKYRSANHSIALCGPLDLPEAALLIPPYTLGVWLGDGDTDSARITVAIDDWQIVDNIAAEGVPVREQARHAPHIARVSLSNGHSNRSAAGPAPIHVRLRELGVLGDKHIPPGYLRASFDQRHALLQGLMDTDGYIDGVGQCEFTSTSEKLASGTVELVRSLGIKAFCTASRARLNGRDVGPKWRVTFHPPADLFVFRLDRKRARHVKRHERRRLAGDRRIRECSPIASVPVRCIGVDSPSHMYLAGKAMVPTHNSPFAAGVGHLMLVADGEPRAEIYAAAAKKEQAQIMFGDAVIMRDQSPALSRRLQPSGKPPLTWNLLDVKTGSFFRPISSDRKKSGARPHCSLIDEIHEHEDANTVDMLRAGTKGRRQPIVFEITNSGFDRTSVCWEHHDYSTRVLQQVHTDDTWFAYVCALDEGDDWTDERVWKKANPNLGVSIQLDYLRGRVNEALGMPSIQNVVRRLNFCEWTDAEAIGIPIEQWMAGATSFDEAELQGRECFLGLDLSSVGDLSAGMYFFPAIEGMKARLIRRYWLPGEDLSNRCKRDRVPYDIWAQQGHLSVQPGNKRAMRFDLIEKQILEDSQRFVIREIAIDPFGAMNLMNQLSDHGFSVVIMQQGFTILSPPTKELLRLVALEEIEHGGDPVLNWMAANVALEQNAVGDIRPNKKKSRAKIDGIVAAVMAIDRASRHGMIPRSIYEDRHLYDQRPPEEPEGGEPGPGGETETPAPTTARQLPAGAPAIGQEKPPPPRPHGKRSIYDTEEWNKYGEELTR